MHYKSPEILTVDARGRTRVWYIVVRLIDGDNIPKVSVNWDDIFTETDTKNSIAQTWTVHGLVDGNKTKSIPTYTRTGKNIGRKNETSVFEQAVSEAKSKYNKKNNVVKNRYYPMAVHKYDATPRDESKRIRYPVAVQRKLDGGRMIAYFDAKVILYSRKLKDVKNTLIERDLKSLFVKYPGIYLDGEVYKHGMSLQNISGAMRKEKKELKLEYHIFDVFFPDKQLPYIERKQILDEILPESVGLIKKVQTYIADTKEEETKLYQQFLDEKYEGSIVRNLDAFYEHAIDREKRTYQARKRKPRSSDEFKITGFTQGTKGKDVGAIVWILETSDGHPFTAVPVDMTYEERYQLFNEMSIKNTYKNKMMTVEYDDISENGVPLRAKAKCIRLI